MTPALNETLKLIDETVFKGFFGTIIENKEIVISVIIVIIIAIIIGIKSNILKPKKNKNSRTKIK